MLTLRRLILGLFVVQSLTGLLLMTVYSPSTTTAWGSVWYIQTQVSCGWLIRGLHHFASDALILLLLFYAGRLLLSKLYRSPHQFVWWSALAALGVSIALSLSGHLLPWDQAGYWGTKVRTNILNRTPLLGEWMAKVLVGGADFGNLTLTRFYALHVAILPLALGWLIFRVLNRPFDQGRDREGAEPFRCRLTAFHQLPPAVAAAIALFILLATTWYFHDVRGLQLLDAPGDPSATDYPARPEWHTLFLYQWLKASEGPVLEVVGAIVMPSVIALAFFLLPFADRALSPLTAHRLAIGLTTTVVLSVLGLTFAAKWDDRDPSDGKFNAVREKQKSGATLLAADEAVLRARQFNRQRDQAARDAKRALELAASDGIPPEGPLALLARDPWTAGPRIFAIHCAACHRYDGHNGRGDVPFEPATSSDLAGFASREWIGGLLANPMDDRYFGRMRNPEGEPAHTRMSRFIGEIMPEGDDARRSLLTDFDAVAVFLTSESSRPIGESPPFADLSSTIARGREVFMNTCNECHSYGVERAGTTLAPEMLGYGSVQWIELMIAEPDHDSRYRAVGRERARMPRFQDRLSQHERNMIAVWLHDGHAVNTLSD